VSIPSQLLTSLEGIKGFDREGFIHTHELHEAVTSVRINPAKPLMHIPSAEPVPWTQYGFYLPERPSFTFDPLFHAGTYYVQEASSMFLEQAVKQTVDLNQPLKVLDLCAAPGGKSTHIQSLLSKDSLLVSNEVIRSRVNILMDNIIKWGAENVIVTNNDPRDLTKLEGHFDLIVVDAPCSGSGLIRKDPEAINEWSENNVMLCSQRQQRILDDIWPALKKGGVIIYSTCSYSKEEDEDIFDWLVKEKEAAPQHLQLKKDWNISDTGKGYRFWPDKIKGEGFYLSAFRKVNGGEASPWRVRKMPTVLTNKELSIVKEWMDSSGKFIFKNGQTVYSWLERQVEEFAFLLQELRVVTSGIVVGELVHEKLIPSHALAMTNSVLPSIERVELVHERAIKYLQRKELDILPDTIGWKLAACQGHALGWMNVLKNRINNYYPTELRIRKEQ
jgi:NOL1/NOP2/sun family putative RNA methylase